MNNGGKAIDPLWELVTVGMEAGQRLSAVRRICWRPFAPIAGLCGRQASATASWWSRTPPLDALRALFEWHLTQPSPIQLLVHPKIREGFQLIGVRIKPGWCSEAGTAAETVPARCLLTSVLREKAWKSRADANNSGIASKRSVAKL